MNRSQDINELAASLAKAQAQMTFALKDSTNPHFRSKYADLASVWDAVRKPLTDNGLSVVQLPEESDDGLVLTTIIMHTSGQFISSKFKLPVTKQDAQGYGSALTYARRYSLAAITGCVQDDDDGNAAVGKPPVTHEVAPQHAKVQSNEVAISEQQIKAIYAISKKKGIDISEMLNGSDIKSLSREQASQLIQTLQAA